MIDLLAAPSHLVALRVSGLVQLHELEQAIAVTDGKLQQASRLSFYAEIEQLEGMTADALARDAQYEFGLLQRQARLYRTAIVTDEPWIKALAKLSEWVAPRLETRIFPMREKQAAMSWAQEAPTAPPAPSERPAIRLIETAQPSVLAYELNGYVTAKDLPIVARPFAAACEQNSKVRLLARLTRFEGFDWNLFRQDDTIALKIKALKHLERYAVVGGPEYIPGLIELWRHLVAFEMRHFPMEREADAWAWIGTTPAKG